MEDTTEPRVIHNRDAFRFEVEADGALSVLDYRIDADVLTILHTRVPAALQGRGIAARLTRSAFEHAREARLGVRPACSYAAGWAQRHPEFADLLV